MKKTLLFLTLIFILSLSGCAVNGSAAAECVADVPVTTVPPAHIILADLPQELALTASADEGKHAVFCCDDYEVTEEIFAAVSLDDAFVRLTGRSSDTLLPIRTADFPHERYEYAWTAAGEGETAVCCGTLLFDGDYYYALTVRCSAENMVEYREAFSALLAGVELEET